MNEKIAIVGAGNMGGALGRGLEANGVSGKYLMFTDSTTHNNREVTSLSNVIILAVKPQKIDEVLKEIKGTTQGKLIISVAAGITMESIAEALGDSEQRIIRVMPNLGAQVDKSMSAWVANEHVTEEDKTTIRNILKPIGKEVEIEDEELMDVITILSGSGPGILSFFLEAMLQGAEKLGLSGELALTLLKQTLIGTAELLDSVYEDPASLRRAVTSERGTTDTAVNTMRADMVDLGIQDGLFAGHRRARELARELQRS